MADYSFPFGQALELFLACFKGTVSAKINSLQQQLQKTDIIPQPDNEKQVQKLNKLESQAWLYKGILERIGSDPSANHEKVAKTLEALEYKRSEILQELEPRRPQSYRVLAGIQDSARDFLASQAEKDYEQLEKIVINLVLFANSRQPSQTILSEVINELAAEIGQSSDQISPYRLRLAYKIDELMKAVSARLILGSTDSTDFKADSDYQALVNELRSRISLLSEQFSGLLRTRQESTSEVNRRVHEISNLTRNISDLHRTISNRDSDVDALQRNAQQLIESTQRKQSQIESLQSSLFDLQRDLQNSTEVNQERQSQINYLQSQLSQLNQERTNLQKKLQDVTDYALIKESEVVDLQNEKTQLNSQKAGLQQQYRSLYQNHQQKQNEIADLMKQLEDLTNKRVATEEKISLEEWARISNKSDYVYVRGYPKKNGTWVDAYYRRPPQKRSILKH